MRVEKICKKALLVLAVVTLMASPAMAALVGNGSPGGGDESLERVLDGGINVVFREARKSGRSGYNGTYIALDFIFTAEEDIKIKVGGATLYDNLGNEFDYTDANIGNQHNVDERLIIGGVATSVTLLYNCGDYVLPTVFSRAGLIVNGKTITFRNLPGGGQ